MGILEQFSADTITPEMIVVGIPNTNRTRDFTPSQANLNLPLVTQEGSEQPGGGKNFYLLLKRINPLYRQNIAYRTL